MNNDKIIFIFDFDGVIVDSITALYNIYIEFLKSFDIEGDKEEFSQLNGPKMSEIVSILKSKHSIQEEEKELLKTYLERLSEMYNTIELYPGVKETLNLIKKNGFKIALASSSKRNEIEYVLNKFNLSQFFDFIVTGDEVINAKPSPEIYNIVKKKYPNFKYYVTEDSENGMQSAISAGMSTIFFNPENRYTQKEVVYQINKMEQLGDVILEMDLDCFTVCKADKVILKIVTKENDFSEIQKKKNR